MDVTMLGFPEWSPPFNHVVACSCSSDLLIATNYVLGYVLRSPAVNRLHRVATPGLSTDLVHREGVVWAEKFE